MTTKYADMVGLSGRQAAPAALAAAKNRLNSALTRDMRCRRMALETAHDRRL